MSARARVCVCVCVSERVGVGGWRGVGVEGGRRGV